MKQLLSLFALLGCSTLPEYAAPKGGVAELSSLDSSDVISYRQLTRADFRGTHAPPEFAKVADRVGAATCGQVRPTGDSKFFVKWRQETPTSDKKYWVEVNKLSFMALMDRRCSWWNDKAAARAADYVLQHEQIHFALYELGARKLNTAAEAIKRDMISQGDSQAEVEGRAQSVLKDALSKATEDMLERNHEFDEDTSLGYRPDRQRAWLARVTNELSETQAYASPALPD